MVADKKNILNIVWRNNNFAGVGWRINGHTFLIVVDSNEPWKKLRVNEAIAKLKEEGLISEEEYVQIFRELKART